MEEVQNEIIWGFLQSNINLGRGIKMFCENELFMTSFRGVSINFSCCLGKYCILYFRDLNSGDHASPSLSSRNGKNAGLRYVSSPWQAPSDFLLPENISLLRLRNFNSKKLLSDIPLFCTVLYGALFGGVEPTDCIALI